MSKRRRMKDYSQFSINYLFWGLISGILMGLTVAPANLWFCAWIALIPLWITISQSSRLTATITAFMWGCGYHGLALFWITGIHPMTWMGVAWWNSLLIALFCWFFITAWGAVLVTIWAYLAHQLYRLNTHKSSFVNNNFIKIVAIVSLWCLLEKIWSFTPLWWTSLSFTQSPYNLALLQLLKFSGTTTITALILLVNFVLAQGFVYLIKERNKLKFGQNLIVAVTILLITHLVGFYLYQSPIVNDEKQQIKIGIIQGNVPNEVKLYDPGLDTAIENYSQGYLELANQDVDLYSHSRNSFTFFLWRNKK